jgi:hypothetical protein
MRRMAIVLAVVFLAAAPLVYGQQAGKAPAPAAGQDAGQCQMPMPQGMGLGDSGRAGMKGMGPMMQPGMGRMMVGQRTMISSGDGGVIVMVGNRLLKYDRNLNLKKEVMIKMDMPGGMMGKAGMNKPGMMPGQEGPGCPMCQNCPMCRKMMAGEMKAGMNPGMKKDMKKDENVK